MTSPPIHTLVHIGAGNRLAEYRQLNCQKLVLIEPLPARAERLRRLTADMPNTEVWELAISSRGNNQPAILTEYNLADYSSLHLTNSLPLLYPGIRETNRHKVTTLTPAAMLERLQLPKNEQHKLVVEAPGEEAAIIAALAQCKQLHYFTQLQMSLPTQPFFQISNSPAQLTEQLQQEGFSLNSQNNEDSDISIQEWRLNPLKPQVDSLNQQVIDLTQQLSSANEQINQLTTQPQQQQQVGNKLTELEQKMEQLFASQAEQLRQNTNALGQHVTKMHASSNRQWQAALAVQHSLSFGEQPLQFSDISISPELAQHLITLVQNNNYDLIIEFGSGHSTSLLARALLSQHKHWQGNSQLALHNNETQTHLMPREHELPKRVISFEHNKTYYQQTLQSIKQQGLSEVVELVHVPLVNCTFSPEHLFYDCEPKLQQLASLLQNEEKHILVLVDGPSAEPTEHSRTPALPVLLNHFARHRLDVVLDDHHRDSEQQSAEQWRSQLAERSLGFKEHIWAGDKSALLLSINS
ncbi:hypothetical protein [Oceanimonas sp. CAM02]|uniref:hypothetical protein n=1 Tax=Oceanimonas sp. CAM02 TaxID=3080336 RepID=UPI0029365518|nr:hypothetical protein [Oceanimonas sp. CAM02]MDV2857243.1 hypothetical protein [Oceanimonas sp. CAM02]